MVRISTSMLREIGSDLPIPYSPREIPSTQHSASIRKNVPYFGTKGETFNQSEIGEKGLVDLVKLTGEIPIY